MSYNSYKINELKNFNDVINAFSLYTNGGFWVKKLINKKGTYNVSVEGPYDINQAEKTADRWRDIISYEGIETAEVLSFNELVCNNNDIEEIDNINSWKPEIGMKLICLTHGNLKAVYYPEKETKNTDFIKYFKFVESRGVTDLCTGNMKIYYNKNDTEGFKLASVLKKFFINSDKFSKEEQVWIINKILTGKSNKGTKPFIIPEYILKISTECSEINIQYFKDYFDLKISSKRKLTKAFNYLKKCSPENLIEIEETDNKIFIRFEFDLLLIKNDKCPKKMYIEKHKDTDIFNILLSDYSESFCIGIFNIENSKGEMRIDIPTNVDDWNNFIKHELGSDNEINSLNYYGSILLFVSRCLGIKEVVLKDDRSEDCICNSNIGVYINPIRYLAGVESIYYNLGFMEESKEEVEYIIENYKPCLVSDITNRDIGKYNDITLEELSILYLEKLCKYSYMCDVISDISNSVYMEMENCCTLYKLKLDEKDLGYYRSFFK